MLICTVFICIEAWMFISYKQNFCPAFIQTQAFIFSVHLSGQGQGRMSGASTSAYKFDSVVRGNHVCKTMDFTHC